MPQPTSGTGSKYSRRDILAYGGVFTTAMGGGLTFMSKRSSARRITRRAVIPRAEDFTTNDYTGFFLHIGDRSTGDIETSVIKDCNFTSWSPGETAAYNGTLINRLEENHRQVPTETFVNSKQNFKPGTLWVITQQLSCPKNYIGLEIEQLGSRIKQTPETPETTETAQTTGASGGGGAGLGLLAALAGGAAGIAELMRRHS